jgi:hypothetical protein
MTCVMVLGRFDLKIPDYVVKQLNLEELLLPIISRLHGIMKKSNAVIRTHNVVFAPIGSPPQNWHVDDTLAGSKGASALQGSITGKRYNYFTILIHLNPIDDMCGGTEIWGHNSGDMVII